MSDQQRTGAATSLEEVFLSREFGRSASHEISFTSRVHEVVDPPQLEQVFLSETFGQPEVVTATAPAVAATAPALVALPGRGGNERDSTRYRAIAAVSGVAAAALVVAGISSGTGQPAKQPTVSAQGTHHTGSNSPPPTGGSPSGNGTPQPAPAGTGTTPVATTGSGSGAPVARLASVTTPTNPEVIVEVPPGTTVEVVPTTTTPAPPAGTGAGTPPPAAAGSGILTPLLVVVGDTVTTVGTTVTAASDGLGTALPVASSLTGLLGNLGATVANLGRSVASTTT